MKFIEMTGATLDSIINDDELHVQNLDGAGVKPDSIVRVNEQGDIEVRRALKWDVICLLYTSPSPRDATLSRMPSSA